MENSGQKIRLTPLTQYSELGKYAKKYEILTPVLKDLTEIAKMSYFDIEKQQRRINHWLKGVKVISQQ